MCAYMYACVRMYAYMHVSFLLAGLLSHSCFFFFLFFFSIKYFEHLHKVDLVHSKYSSVPSSFLGDAWHRLTLLHMWNNTSQINDCSVVTRTDESVQMVI